MNKKVDLILNIIYEYLELLKYGKREAIEQYMDKYIRNNNFILSNIDEDEFKDCIIIILKKYLLLSKEDIELFIKNTYISISSLESIIKKIIILKYSNFKDIDVLGEDILFKIITSEKFISSSYRDKIIERVKHAIRYHLLSYKYFDSTIPFSEISYNGINIKRYNNNDRDIFTCGIDTYACFKIFGIDNDFFLYSLFDKNGIVLRLCDENNNLIGRVSGFRNGNMIYFNQLRTIYDDLGKDNDVIEIKKRMRKALEVYSNKLIKDTKDDISPIEYVIILGDAGYLTDRTYEEIDPFLIDRNPMDTKSIDWLKFKTIKELTFKYSGDSFTTGYQSPSRILLLASKDNRSLIDISNIKHYDVESKYYRPRIEVITIYDNFNKLVLNEINRIKALSDMYYGIKYSTINDLDNVLSITLGSDFYIIIYKDNRVLTCLFPMDNRSLIEYNKYYKDNINIRKKTYK